MPRPTISIVILKYLGQVARGTTEFYRVQCVARGNVFRFIIVSVVLDIVMCCCTTENRFYPVSK